MSYGVVLCGRDEHVENACKTNHQIIPIEEQGANVKEQSRDAVAGVEGVAAPHQEQALRTVAVAAAAQPPKEAPALQASASIDAQ